MVGCNGYRNPALFAKMAATVDVASHGRMYAGIGAGWSEHEWKAYGYPWTSQKERMGSFIESVELLHRLWTEEDVVFQGQVPLGRQSVRRPAAQTQALDRWRG